MEEDGIDRMSRISGVIRERWRPLFFQVSGFLPHPSPPRSLRLCVLPLLFLAASAQAEWTNGVWFSHGLALHGDLKYPADFKHFDYVNPEAPKGGTIRLDAVGGFDTLHSFIPRGTPPPPVAAGLPFESLTVNSLDEPFSVYGLLAESIEMPTNRAWVAYRLRPEARWHDGKPVTADDVVFSLNILREKGAPLFRLYYRDVTRVEKLGDRHVRFHFATNEVNRELPLIMGQLPILPAHWWATRDFTASTLDPVLGSGPYRIASVDANRFITYERVTNYWGRDLPVSRGMYNFDTVRYDFYRDATVSHEAFKSGAYDWRLENSAKTWALGYDTPDRSAGVLKCETFPSGRIAFMQAFVFNQRRPAFQDPRTRRAISLAFDFEWANRALFHNQYTRCRSFFGNSDLEAAGLPQGEELRLLRGVAARHPADVPAEVFEREYRPATTDLAGGETAHRLSVRRNLIEAQDLLRAAGWKPRESDGQLVHSTLRDASGAPLRFEFEILLVQPTFERVALPLRLSLRRLGIEARVRTVDVSVYMNRLLEYDYDMISGSWPQSESPGNEQREFWHSMSADQKGGRNTAGVRNPAVDELIDEVIRAPDRKALIAATRALDRLLQWQFICIPNWYLPVDRIAFWDRFGYPPAVESAGTTWIFWWNDAAKASALSSRRDAVRRSQAPPSAPGP